MIQSYKDLKVYQLSFAAANEVFRLSKDFPKEELYALTDQLRRSSRSGVANIVEGWAKRHYENIFRRHTRRLSAGPMKPSSGWISPWNVAISPAKSITASKTTTRKSA